MKVAVCVKQVPEGTGGSLRIDPSTKRLVRSGEGALNHFDANAVEEALRVKDATGDPDVVLFGQQASDSDGAVLWAAVAERLRRPLISQAAELSHADGKLRVKRQTEFGYDVIEAPLPAVIAVSDAINEPRYPSLKGIMGAKKKPQETVSLAELGVEADRAGEAGSRTEVYTLSDPPPRGETRRIDDDGTAPEKIVEFLLDKKAL